MKLFFDHTKGDIREIFGLAPERGDELAKKIQHLQIETDTTPEVIEALNDEMANVQELMYVSYYVGMSQGLNVKQSNPLASLLSMMED